MQMTSQAMSSYVKLCNEYKSRICISLLGLGLCGATYFYSATVVRSKVQVFQVDLQLLLIKSGIIIKCLS